MEKPETKTQSHHPKTTPASFDERIHKLKEVQRGWLQYYRMASIQENSKMWMGGCVTGYVAVSGNNGRNPNEDGKT